MKQVISLLLLALLPVVALATLINGHNIVNGTAMQGYELIARTCKDISCVQQNVQMIDSQIADLLARRLAFIRRGGELKNSNAVAPNVQLNPNQMRDITRQAQYQGYPPEIAQSIFKEIDRQSTDYENKFKGTVPADVLPNTSSTPTPPVNNPVLTPSIIPSSR